MYLKYIYICMRYIKNNYNASCLLIIIGIRPWPFSKKKRNNKKKALKFNPIVILFQINQLSNR